MTQMYMDSKIFRNIVVVVIMSLVVVSMDLLAQVRSGDDLLKIMQDAWNKRGHTTIDGETQEDRLRESLNGLSDEEKTHGFYLLILEQEKKRPMISSVGMDVANALGRDPDLIVDGSAMKAMLREENDPRKFCLKMKMATMQMKYQKEDFVSDMIHMLYRDGIVSRPPSGEFDPLHFKSAKFYAYEMILFNLKQLEAPFNPPPEDLSYERRIPVLIKWLKANWPGCENLEIPGEKREDRRDAPVEPSSRQAEERRDSAVQEMDKESRPSSPRWPYVAGGLAVLAAMGIWLKGKLAA